MGVIWFVVSESKSQESRGCEFSTKFTILRILLKIKVLLELAIVAEPIMGEEWES